jgi:type IV secretory pathway VirB10-like protein
MKRLATLVLLLAALPASAVLYKWVDKDGKVHYSDQPPPETARESGVVNAPPPSARPPAPSGDTESPAPRAAPKSAAEQEMEFRKRRLEAAEADAKRQQEAQAAEEKQRNCTLAKNRLAALETGGRITKYGPNGETVYLSDAEIARELGDARKVADSWCK